MYIYTYIYMYIHIYIYVGSQEETELFSIVCPDGTIPLIPCLPMAAMCKDFGSNRAGASFVF